MTLLEAVLAAMRASTHTKGVGWTIPPREYTAMAAAVTRERERIAGKVRTEETLTGGEAWTSS